MNREQQEAESLRRALQWYADPSNYHDSDTAIDALRLSHTDMDKGQRARNALKPHHPASDKGVGV